MDNQPLLKQLLADLPQTLKTVKDEVGSVGKSLLDAQLRKTDLVTRDEFLLQQQKLDALLAKLARIEQQLEQLMAADKPV